MNFDIRTKSPCVVPETAAPDSRCNDAEFALSNPTVCATQGVLIIKPGAASLCVSDSIQFRVYEYRNGLETELTSGITFASSDADVFAVGVNGGGGTALAVGDVNITATDGTRTVTSRLTVLPQEGCCDSQRIITAIVVDNSRSMSLNFGGGYATRLAFAKAIASAWGGSILEVSGSPKDADKVWKLNSVATDLLGDFSDDTTEILSAIAGVAQTQEKTTLLPAFDDAGNDLIDTEADRRVLLLVSDGEQTDAGDSVQEVLDAAALFKGAGGVVVVVGCRASGVGFDLLERSATGGFFVNATPDNASEAFTELNRLKQLLCAGECLPLGDTYENVPELEYSDFANWEVLAGKVNLLGPGLLDLFPGNGLYVETASGAKGLLRTIDRFDLVNGKTYGIALHAAGNQRAEVAGQGLKLYLREAGAAEADPNIFEQAIYPDWNSTFDPFHFSFTADADVTVKLYVEQLGDSDAPESGNLIDSVKLENISDGVTLLLDSFDDENLTYIPPRCGPNAAVAGIADPDSPSVYDAPYSGTQTICNGESYTYAVSWVTLGGETAASPIATLVSANDPTMVVRVTLPAAPETAVAARLWRNVADGNAADLFLLRTVNPQHEIQFDLEDHAAFLARYDASLTPPTTNTTDIASGDLGTGYADCCYYEEVADETPTQEIFSAEFTDSGAYLQRDGALTGAANNKRGTLSVWFKTDSAGVNFGIIGDNSVEDLLVFVGPLPEIDAWNSGHAQILELQGAQNCADGQWHHLLASWDLADVARRHLYIDGVDVTQPVIFTNDDINWSQPQMSVGLNNGIGGDGGLLAELWLDNSYLDLSIQANREKFRTAAGKPAVLGLDGSTPTGQVPLVYLRQQVPDWDVNQGTGGGFTETGAIGDGGADVPGGVVSPSPGMATTFTDNCPECSDDLPGVQESDSNPLPDIETAFTPPVVFTSTKQGCAECASGSVNLAEEGAAYEIVSNTVGDQIITVIHLTGDALAPYFYQIGRGAAWYPVAWTLEGSNDGVAWTILDTRISQSFFSGEIKKVLVLENTTAYAYFRIVITEWSGTASEPELPADGIVFAEAEQRLCASATETSTINQQDADSKAKASAVAAAAALLNCSPLYSSTRSFTAHCNDDSTQTRSRTRQSLVSQADADELAQNAAMQAANDACPGIS